MNALAITRTAGPLHIEYGDAGEVFGIYAADGKCIIETDSGVYPPNAADAAFIVQAWNEHDDLIAALRLIERQAAADDNALIRNYARAALTKAGAL